VVSRRGAVETSEWFSTATAARAALLSTQDAGIDLEWAALVKLEDAPTAPPRESASPAETAG
jgi:hypothetical protein